jgi:hypothetical protein
MDYYPLVKAVRFGRYLADIVLVLTDIVSATFGFHRYRYTDIIADTDYRYGQGSPISVSATALTKTAVNYILRPINVRSEFLSERDPPHCYNNINSPPSVRKYSKFIYKL